MGLPPGRRGRVFICRSLCLCTQAVTWLHSPPTSGVPYRDPQSRAERIPDRFAMVDVVVKRLRYGGPSGRFGRRPREGCGEVEPWVAGSNAALLSTFTFSNERPFSPSKGTGIEAPANNPSSRNQLIDSRIDSAIGRYVIPRSRTDFPFSIDAPARRKSAIHGGRRGGARVMRERSSPVREASHTARPPRCRDGMGVPEAAEAIRKSSPHATFCPETMYRSPTRPR